MTADSPAKRRSLSKFRKNLEVAERDARACRMYYVDRMTYREVAEALGFANEGGAKRSADRGLKAIQTKGNEDLIAEVRARIQENREFVRGKRDSLWVPRTSSMSRDQAILVDQTGDASLSPDAVLVEIDRLGQRFQRRRAVQETVRPVLVMVILVIAQDLLQMALVPDKGAVQELASASPDPAFRRSRSYGASARCTARSGSQHRRGPRRMRR